MTRYFGVHTLEGEWHSLLPRYVLLSERVRDKRVLDIGCGTGIGSSLLLELGAEQVNAIDHRPAVLELARVKHAKDGLDFHVMFWEELDFPDDCFDIVLCLDPTSPVTDPSLLLEIKRVLKPSGEYVCAIERRNVTGVESLLPRYGYNDGAENVELTRKGDRVPQLGQLTNLFETVTPVIQRPRYSYIFDFAAEGNELETHTVRKVSSTDESGLWVGADPNQETAEATDQRPGRWISHDDFLCERENDPAAVDVLFCGDSHMPAPELREVELPYLGVVERLHQIITDLQIRQHPSRESTSFHLVDDPGQYDPPTQPFSQREQTSEFHALSSTSGDPIDRSPRTHHREHRAVDDMVQIRDELEQMTYLYQQMRQEMENLFLRTRQELVERDRYIEHLVDTVHRWQHRIYHEEGEAPSHPSGFDAEPTNVFARVLPEEDEDSETQAESGEDVAVEASHSAPEDKAETASTPDQAQPDQAQPDNAPEHIATLKNRDVEASTDDDENTHEVETKTDTATTE